MAYCRAVILLLLVLCGVVRAEIIPAIRLIDWSTPGVPGGIPNRTTIAATVSPGGNIQSAINAAAAGTVVKLTSGTFTLTSAILLDKGITLRGTVNASGVPTTILQFTPVTGDVIQMQNNTTEGPKVALSSNWLRGTTSFTVTSASGLSNGVFMVVCTYQPSWATFYGVYGTDSYPGRNDEKWRIGQIVRVTNVSGNTITVDRPAYLDYTTQSGNPPKYMIYGMLQGAGVEDLEIRRTNSASGYGSNIAPQHVDSCWIKNVKSVNTKNYHFYPYIASRITIEHCYIDSTDAAYEHSGDRAYGIHLNDYCSDSLFHNNILTGTRHSIIFQSGGLGNVISYNYTVAGKSDDPNFVAEDLCTHTAYPLYNLWEGNYCSNIQFDNTHGPAAYQVAFRNYLLNNSTGITASNRFGRTGWKPMSGCIYNSIVGCIIGATGDTGTQYGTVSGVTSSYSMGWWDTAIPPPIDPNVASTAYIHGTYDYIGNQITWNSGNADHTLPNSLYLAAKPSWFGNLAWPPFSPTSPGAADPTDIPAGYRYLFGTDPSSSGTAPDLSSSPSTAFAELGPTPFSYRIIATGTVASYSIYNGQNVVGIDPDVPWLHLGSTVGTATAATGTISGVYPSAPDSNINQWGRHYIKFSATNASGTGTGGVTISVRNIAPDITSSLTATGTRGVALVPYTGSASGVVPIIWSQTGLPAGLSMGTPGIITGTPSTAGTSNVLLSARNTYGTSNKTLVLTVNRPRGLIGWWPFETGSGTAIADISGNNITGTAIGTPIWTTDRRQGDFAFQFSGSNSISFGDIDDLDAQSQISVAVWMKAFAPPESYAGWVADVNTDGLGGFGIEYSTIQNLLWVWARNSYTNNGQGSLSIPPGFIGAWHHVGMVYDGLSSGNANRLKLYIDGQQVNLTYATGSIASVTNQNSGPFRAGQIPIVNSIQAFSVGCIDDLRVYNIALGSAAIAEIAAGTAAPLLPPVINSATTATGTVGVTFMPPSGYQITATGTPTSFNAFNLPGGLSVNTISGFISGTPTSVGVTGVTLLATNASGTGQTAPDYLTITIGPGIVPPLAPVISFPTGTIAGITGSGTSISIIASGTPTSYQFSPYTSSIPGEVPGLPPGISLGTVSGIASGTPTTVGTFTSTLKAINASGTGESVISWAISSGAPQITSPTSANGIVGSFLSYTITATNNPTAFFMDTPNPPGLTINGTSGVISGTPVIVSSTRTPIRAVGITGTGTAFVDFNIRAPQNQTILMIQTGTPGVFVPAYPLRYLRTQ